MDTALVSSWLAEREKREGDADWKWAFALAMFGLVATVVSVVQGVSSAADASAAGKRIAAAEKKASDLEQSIKEDAMGLMTVEQSDAITQSGPPPSDKFSLSIRGSKFDNRSQQLAGGLHQALAFAGWMNSDDLMREDISHKGVLIVAKEKSKSLDRLEEILRRVGLEFMEVIESDFAKKYGEHTDAVISVGKAK